MSLKPTFTPLNAVGQSLLDLRSLAIVPEGKGGHVFVDGKLHRTRDNQVPIKGDAAFGTNVNEKELIHLCEMLDMTALEFYDLTTTTIALVSGRCRLQHLHINGVQKIAGLSPLSEMSLQPLRLDDACNAQISAPFAKIEDLESLSISGGMNSIQTIEALTRLTGLRKLAELQLVAIKPGDLGPLADCRAFGDLMLPNIFETEQYAYLFAKRSEIEVYHWQCMKCSVMRSLEKTPW